MNNPNYEKNQITLGQAYKFIAPFIMIVAFIIFIVDTSQYYFHYTRPCALYSTLDLVIIGSVFVFSFVSSLPMKVRFINENLRKISVEVLITVTMSASISYLFVEAMDSPFHIYHIFEPSYLTNDIVRALFFILIFTKELKGKEILRPFIILSGIVYDVETIAYYFFSDHYAINMSTIAMIIAVSVTIIYESVFYDLQSAFTFSSMKGRKYHLINEENIGKVEINYVSVVEYSWRDECLHLLVYTSDERYLDVCYEFVPTFFLAAVISLEKENINRDFLIKSELHKITRTLSTYSKI